MRRILGAALAAALSSGAVAAPAARAVPHVRQVIGLLCGYATSASPPTATPAKPDTQNGEWNAGPAIVTTGASSVTIACDLKVGQSFTTTTDHTVACTTPGTVGVCAGPLALGTVKPTTRIWLCTKITWTAGVGPAGMTTHCTSNIECLSSGGCTTTSLCSGPTGGYLGYLWPTVCANDQQNWITTLVEGLFDLAETALPTAARATYDVVEALLLTDSR